MTTTAARRGSFITRRRIEDRTSIERWQFGKGADKSAKGLVKGEIPFFKACV